MAVTDPFPLNIELKVDSPELTAWLAQNGRDKFANAEDINKILIALDYLRQNIGAGTGVTIEEVLEAILPLANDITNVGTNLETHENNVNNPHQTTLDQILLAGNIATNKTLFLKYNFGDENITELRHDSISMYDASFLTRMQMSKDSFLARNTASGSTKINFGSTISEAKILIRNLTGTIALLSDLTNKADLVGGLVPSSQLPSFVDDVLEFANLAAFPVTGETSKIYLALDTNFTYRWSGSAYVQIGGGSEEIWKTSRYANWRILKAEALGGNQGAITFTNSLGFLNTGTNATKTSTYDTGNFIDTIRRIGLTSVATAGAEVQRRVTSGISCSTKSGFYFCADTISEDAATVAKAADLVGLGNTFATPFGNTEPSTASACVLLAYDSTDTNMQIMHNDTSGTCTKIDLGANFPARTNATDLYRLELYCDTNATQINYRVTRLNTGNQVSGTLTINIPISTIPLTLGFWRGNRSTALAVTKSFSQITIATPY